MTAQKPVVAFIFARGGSKGLPGKNIKQLDGIPLLGRAIKCAQACKSIDRIIVSTDDDEIIAVAHEYGAEIPFKRPAELASDASPEWLSWQHAIGWTQENGGIGTFVSLPATSPLRQPIDVEACIDALDSQTDMVLTAREATRSPYFNMVQRNKDGYVELAQGGRVKYSRRQDAPVVYDLTTVSYVSRPEFILNHNNIFDGRVRAVLIPRARAVDIDDMYDFVEAEAYLLNNLLDGKPKLI